MGGPEGLLRCPQHHRHQVHLRLYALALALAYVSNLYLHREVLLLCSMARRPSCHPSFADGGWVRLPRFPGQIASSGIQAELQSQITGLDDASAAALNRSGGWEATLLSSVFNEFCAVGLRFVLRGKGGSAPGGGGGDGSSWLSLRVFSAR